MLRLVCSECRYVFLRLQSVGESGVTCPRCGVVFQPDEEELYDPEND
jgi:phage FluMu protein Com